MRASLSWSLSFFRDKKSYACVGQSFETIMARYLSLCVSSTRPHHCPQGVNLGTELPQDSEVQMFEAALFSVLVGDVALPALSQNRSPKPSVFTAGRSTQSGMRWSFSTSASMFVHLFMYQILPLYLWGFQDKRSNSNIFESMNTQNWSMFLLSHPILLGNHRSHICWTKILPPHKAEQGLRRSKSGASTLAVALRQFERPGNEALEASHDCG